MKQQLSKLVAGFALSAAIVGTSHAGPFSGLVFFGDSLSDTGNVLSLTTEFGATPFPAFVGAEGRFSNGPVWTEALATGLGIPSAASPANLLFTGAAVIPIGPSGGTNYAFGGARTGLSGAAGPTTGLLGQLINWNGSAFGGSLTQAADPDALYVLSVGMNDMRDARSASPGDTPASNAARQAFAEAAALNVANAVALLAQAGARHFLVSNLLDLGKTPEAVALGLTAESTDATIKFNAALGVVLSNLEATFLDIVGVDLDIRLLDAYGVFEDVFADPGRYGITNLTTPCIVPVVPGSYFFPGSVANNCEESLFSDPLRPSALGHRLIGQLAIESAETTTVPEPTTLALLGFGLASLASARRRKQ